MIQTFDFFTELQCHRLVDDILADRALFRRSPLNDKNFPFFNLGSISKDDSVDVRQEQLQRHYAVYGPYLECVFEVISKHYHPLKFIPDLTLPSFAIYLPTPNMRHLLDYGLAHRDDIYAAIARESEYDWDAESLMPLTICLSLTERTGLNVWDTTDKDEPRLVEAYTAYAAAMEDALDLEKCARVFAAQQVLLDDHDMTYVPYELGKGVLQLGNSWHQPVIFARTQPRITLQGMVLWSRAKQFWALVK